MGLHFCQDILLQADRLGADKIFMRDDQHRFFMLLGQLPARLTAEQAAGFGLVLRAETGLLAGGGVLDNIAVSINIGTNR